MITLNDTTAYHRGDQASLGWEQTISESLKDTSSPYMTALKNRYAYSDVIVELLESKGVLKQGARILEVGGGYGSLARGILERRGDVSVTLLDISPSFQERQREALSSFGDRVEFILADIFDVLEKAHGRRGLGGAFDIVVANEIVGDFPALLDVDRDLLMTYLEDDDSREKVRGDRRTLMDEAVDYISSLDLLLDDIPEKINLPIGAVRFVREVFRLAPVLFLAEHSSDYDIPEAYRGLFREERPHRWPREVLLFGHTEVAVAFRHLKRAIQNEGGNVIGGSLMELLNVRNDDGIRGILLSGSIATETHELLCEFINHVKEYQWVLARG
ncbi:MAG: methyltransferase [Deltaproteobacteria bacterium]|nr:methyltransferase [Candidatus Zymogenaceae bacterium]